MTTNETVQTAIAEAGLSMTAAFVPWSRSRNKGDKEPSLNWTVTILKWTPEDHINPKKAILTTDYMAGCGHCPSYQQRQSVDGREAVRLECETGRKARLAGGGPDTFGGKPILPDLADVLHSLLSDASAIDNPTFEDWAEDNGYDADSRKAEATYRACLEISLKLRAALGEETLAALRTAFQDY